MQTDLQLIFRRCLYNGFGPFVTSAIDETPKSEKSFKKTLKFFEAAIVLLEKLLVKFASLFKRPEKPLNPILRGEGLRGQDLNLRPSGYEPDELPGCSTPRLKVRATD